MPEFQFLQADIVEPYPVAEPVDVVLHLASPASPIDYLRLPLHTLKAFDFLGYKQGQFPHSEKAAAEVLSLPLYPELDHQDQTRVIDAVLRHCP